MKKYYPLLTVYLVLLVFFDLASYAATPKIYAVVVGISKYKDNNIPNLKFPEKDAQAFYDFLISPFSGSIPADNISLLLGPNATRSNIIKEVVDIFKRSSKDDMIIFYFSGHGKGDESDNSGYLLSYDSENDNEAATALSMDELKSKIDRTNAKLKVSYVDACHAGLFKSYNAKGGTAEDNEIIASAFMQSVANANGGNIAFLASSARQQSLEDDKLGAGVFTYYLLKGLKGDADKVQKDATGYNDGLVTVGEVITYLTDKIPAATKYKQKPTVDGTYDEDFPLSVLRSNVLITSEIAKRPEVKKTAKLKLPAVSEKPADERLSPGKTFDGSSCYGMATFINNSKTTLNLYKYHIINNSYSDANIQIQSGKMASSPRIYVFGFTTKVTDCNDKFHDCDFYFSVNDSGVTKYAIYRVSIESGKNQYLIIDEGKLTFQTSKL